jgi:prophage DNA circulation protein
MSWRDRLKTARWRELSFLTDSHEAKEGQRLVVHELPGRDQPVVEDLGARARGWRVSAYFVGADYDLARNKMLTALRTPGAEWLEHPWLGRVWVRAQDWATTESNAEGGWCRVSIDFVPGGGGVPQPEADLVDAAATAVSSYVVTGSEFVPEPMDANGVEALQARVQSAMDQVRTALARARMPLTMLAQVLASVDSAKAVLAEGLMLAGEYGRALRNVSGTLGLAGADGATLTDAERVRAVAAMCRLGQVAPVAMTGLGAADAPALRRNLVAEQAARQQWAVATALQLALADYSTAAARDTVLAAAVAAVDAVLPTAGTDDLFEAAVAARLAVQQALGAQALAPTQTRMVVAPLPSTVLAYRMGVDEGVLLERNAVRHPLFVRGAVYG